MIVTTRSQNLQSSLLSVERKALFNPEQFLRVPRQQENIPDFTLSSSKLEHKSVIQSLICVPICQIHM